MKNHILRLITIGMLLSVCLGMRVNTATAQSTNIRYVVKRHDTLGSIASKHCTIWQVIYDMNRDAIGANPDLIFPGTVLTIPSNCNSAGDSSSGVVDSGPKTNATGKYRPPYYTVAWGDTLFSIGQRFGMDWKIIADANKLSGTTIFAGTALYIPDSSVENQPTIQGPAERVTFAPGANSATRVGMMDSKTGKNYILTAFAGQSMIVGGKTRGEPITVKITNSRGEPVTVIGVNGQIDYNVKAIIPATDDYIITISPTVLPENPTLTFDITFYIQ